MFKKTESPNKEQKIEETFNEIQIPPTEIQPKEEKGDLLKGNLNLIQEEKGDVKPKEEEIIKKDEI